MIGSREAQAGFNFTTVDVPFGSDTEIFDLNNAGTIAGSYLDAGGVRTGFTRTAAGAFSTYEVPGATATRILGINDSGQEVGCYQAGGDQHGFLRGADGTLTTIDYPGQTYNYAYRINNVGQVGGYYFEFPDTPDGIHITSYLRSVAGAYQPVLKSSTGDGTVLRGINNSGVQAGWYFDDSGFIHGLLHDSAGGFTTYDAPNGADTLIDQVNDNGDLVGRTLDPTTFDGTAFLRTASGVFAPFIAPGGDDSEFYSINDAGIIVGTYVDAQDHAHGLIATYSAVPEPTSLGICACTGVGLFKRRRRAKS